MLTLLINLTIKVKKEEIEKMINQWQVPATQSKEESWEILSNRIEESASETKETKVVSFRRNIILAVSIAAVVVLGIVFFLPNSDTELQFSAKQIEPTVLPDGSKVWANANSTIVFNEETWGESRTITLLGEAYFEVKKGSSFQVKTNFGEVTVLGTSFNVLANQSYFEVECYTGKVQVVSSSSKKILTPGLATRKVNNHLVDSYIIQELKADWKNNKFRFDNIPLNQVFDEISTTFKVDIKSSDLSDKLFTGNFEVKDLETALETVCTSMGLSFIIENHTVVIR